MRRKNHIFFITCLCMLSFSQLIAQTYDENKPTDQKKTYIAGEDIVLKFKDLNDPGPLYCSNSYGSIVIAPKKHQRSIIYPVPDMMTQRKGILKWHLKNKGKIISGTIKIVAHQEPKKMNTYLGPPSIIVGGNDLSMLITIPTDRFDNPMRDNTSLKMKLSRQKNVRTDKVAIQDLIAFKRYYSPDEKGKVLLSATCKDTSSKEKTLLVRPSSPEDFKIKAERAHPFADGNQTTILSTTPIYDAYGNLVSDGTFVSFIIKDEKGNQFQTNGTTIDGVARANIVHPDEPQEWSVKAYIEGIASSPTLKLKYLQSIYDMNVAFDARARKVNIGPIKSFMEQLVPDGLEVKLIVKSNDNIIYSSKEMTRDGHCSFYLRPELIPPGYYDIIIKSAGLKRSFKNKHIWQP